MDNNDLSDTILTEFIDKRKGKKKDLYINERKLIVQKIYNILDLQIDNNVKYFYPDDLSEEKENEIINLKDEIKQYFKVGAWMCYKNTIKLDKIHMSIIRNVLKHENINYTITKKMIGGVNKNKYVISDNE